MPKSGNTLQQAQAARNEPAVRRLDINEIIDRVQDCTLAIQDTTAIKDAVKGHLIGGLSVAGELWLTQCCDNHLAAIANRLRALSEALWPEKE